MLLHAGCLVDAGAPKSGKYPWMQLNLAALCFHGLQLAAAFSYASSRAPPSSDLVLALFDFRRFGIDASLSSCFLLLSQCLLLLFLFL